MVGQPSLYRYNITFFIRHHVSSLQAAFNGPQESILELTTQVNIIPNTFPFPDCHGIECQGKLV